MATNKNVFDLSKNEEKKECKQGPNWDVVGRYQDFDSADAQRKRELSLGKLAKVQRLSTGFVVKTRLPKPVNTQSNTTLDENGGGDKQKRQPREIKRRGYGRQNSENV